MTNLYKVFVAFAVLIIFQATSCVGDGEREADTFKKAAEAKRKQQKRIQDSIELKKRQDSINRN